MVDLEVIARAVDFIEAHLRAPVAVAQMAEVASYSLYYFCRMFKASTHHTPYDYLMRRRVTEAARDLVSDSDRKIIDVAFDYQFNNPETFSRAFKRVLGVSPSEWRSRDAPGERWGMPRLTEAHLSHICRGGPWRPEIEDWPAFDLVGVMTLASNTAARTAAWAWLRRALADDNAVGGDYYALTYEMTENAAAGVTMPGRFYMAGVQSAPALAQGRALIVKPMPPMRYVRCTHRGTAREVGLTLDYIYHTWIPQADVDGQGAPRPALPLYLEHFGAVLPPSDTEMGTWDVLVPIALDEA
jgi:AraC family transcriptional regulator